MALRRLLLAAALAAVAVQSAVADKGPGREAVISLQVENDLFGAGTDRHYTHGTRLSYLSTPRRIPWIAEGAGLVPYFNRLTGPEERIHLVLGQSIFTPSDITVAVPAATDRPYAGWLYAGAGLVTRGVDGRSPSGRLKGIRRLELNVGIVGPSAFAEEIQTFVHRIIGSATPRGWSHQLNNEPGFVLYAERVWGPYTLLGPYQMGSAGDLAFDIAPSAAMALGNVFTHGSAGVTLRLGTNLADSWSPPRVRPSLPGGELFATGGISAHVFAAGEVRAVGRNIFLDGNTFTSSPSVDKRHIVYDLQVGLALTLDRVQVSLTNTYRSREFAAQPTADDFGMIAISYAY